MRSEETVTLAARYDEPCDTRADYGTFFDELLTLATAAPLGPATGERIRDYVMPWLETHPLGSFDRYSDRSYVRSYLGRCPRTHWEALVMSWKRGNATTIHGHPAFAGYHFAVGAPGRFDNHLHRITCLSETGHSLHVYSDDALRGVTFTEAE